MRRIALAGVLSALMLAPAPAYAATKKPVHRAVVKKTVGKTTVAPLDAEAAFLAANARQRGVVQTASGLQYRVLIKGVGTVGPGDDDVTLVNYVGKLTNGTVFDQSKRPTPMPVSGVVPGFSEALKAMHKGAKYRVWIKPSLAYGDTARPGMPAHSTLVFDIEMLDFLSKAAVQQLQQQQMMQQQMMQQGGAPGGMPPGGMPGAPGGAMPQGVPGGAPGGAMPSQGN